MSDQTKPTPIRIAICEDQRLMRESLRIVCEQEPDLQVIAEAADGLQAIQVADASSPDILLMDIKMPFVNGVQATASITTRYPSMKILILTTFDDDDLVFEAIAAGAQGYLLKDVPAEELIATIRRIVMGESIIQPTIATRMLMRYGKNGNLAPPSLASSPDLVAPSERIDLSERETEILRLLAQGASNRDIANTLILSLGTIKNYVSAILLKLHAANRTHAAKIARERGLL